MYIFELWCTEEGSYAEKAHAVLNSVIIGIKNKGFAVELTEVKKCIGYTCKKIATYWVKNNQTKNAVLIASNGYWINKTPIFADP